MMSLSLLAIAVMSFAIPMTVSAATDYPVSNEAGLEAALSSVGNGDTIVLTNDIRLTYPLTIERDVSFTIDTKNYQLDCRQVSIKNGSEVFVKGSNNLTTKDVYVFGIGTKITFDSGVVSETIALSGDTEIIVNGDVIVTDFLGFKGNSTITVNGGSIFPAEVVVKDNSIIMVNGNIFSTKFYLDDDSEVVVNGDVGSTGGSLSINGMKISDNGWRISERSKLIVNGNIFIIGLGQVEVQNSTVTVNGNITAQWGVFANNSMIMVNGNITADA